MSGSGDQRNARGGACAERAARQAWARQMELCSTDPGRGSRTKKDPAGHVGFWERAPRSACTARGQGIAQSSVDE